MIKLCLKGFLILGAIHVGIQMSFASENELDLMQKKEEMNRLIKEIEKNETQEIVFPADTVGNKELEQIEKAMNKNTRVQILCIAINNINDKGVVSLVKIIQTNKKLKMLDVSFNKIGDDVGYILLVEAIKYNTLMELDLSGNFITNAGALKIEEFLKNYNTENIALKRFNISGDFNDEDTLKKLTKYQKFLKTGSSVSDEKSKK